MFAATAAVFGTSLFGLCGLFALKLYEERHAHTYAPHIRSFLDDKASQLKVYLLLLRDSLKRFPAVAILIARYFIHVGAKTFARFAKRMERAAHDLADRVSHKHTFKRRVSRSQFLKQVIERNQPDVSPGIDLK